MTFTKKNLYVCALFRRMYRKLFILLFCFLSIGLSAKKKTDSDTIISKVISTVERHSKIISEYEADVYMRTYIHTLNKNFLYKYIYLIPNFVLYDKKNNEAVMESKGQLHYHYPDNYEYDLTHVYGTLTSKSDIMMLPFNLLNVNVYSDVTNDGRFIMPLRTRTRKYYSYRVQSSFRKNGSLFYTIQYAPVYASAKLLKGTFVIDAKTWKVTEFFGIGKDLFLDFSIDIKMGEKGEARYLPKQFTIHRTHWYLGNKIQNRYIATIGYKEVVLTDSADIKHSFDIGDKYRLRIDSVELKRQHLFWDSVRTVPLYAGEKKILSESYSKRDSINEKNKTTQLLTRVLISDSKYKYKKTDINYSGLLNPTMLGYSTYDGFSYTLKLSFKTRLKQDKSWGISLYSGYNSHYKDPVADLSTIYSYNPWRLGTLSFAMGKGNQTFSSTFTQEIQDSLKIKGLSFEDMFVNYYKDYYFRLYNSIEIVNGLQLDVGADYHIRQAKKKEDVYENLNTQEDKVLDIRRNFVPTIRVAWTPGQYYRREGREKIYVHSHYPTFKLELAQSFKDFLGSTSVYNRTEFDISQKVNLGLLRSINYHAGAGMYSRQETEYFADFTHFAPYNYPRTWEDGIGGVFNLLPYSVYNASTSYIQAHVMYETPFLFFTLLPKLSRGVLSERIYFSQLYTPFIVSYSEIGYGIGNRFVNVAVFGSFHKLNFQQIGGKVVFLLGK